MHPLPMGATQVAENVPRGRRRPWSPWLHLRAPAASPHMRRASHPPAAQGKGLPGERRLSGSGIRGSPWVIVPAAQQRSRTGSDWLACPPTRNIVVP